MKRLLLGACLIMSMLASLSANDQRARVLLQAAEAKAKVEGDLTAAIKLYKDAEKEAGANRALVAQALVKTAEIYTALGDKEAQKIYQRLVSEFSDQKEVAALAQSLLGRAKGSTGAAAAKSAEITTRTLPNSSVLPGNITPDGRLMTYVDWNDDGQLHLRDLVTGADRVLTARDDFNVGVPLVARDGTRIAYQTYAGGCDQQKDTGAALCLVDTRGEGRPTPRTIIRTDEIREIAPSDWSPDGRLIAVTLRREDRTAQIGTVDPASGTLRVFLTTDWRGPTRVFFSPDGRHLVYDLAVDDTSSDRTISMLSLDAASKTTVVEHASQNIPMGWTPDGSALLFASDRTGAMALWMQSVRDGRDQGSARLLRSNIGGAWSIGVTTSGGLVYAVRTYDRDISVVDVDVATGEPLSSPVRPIRRYVGTNSFPAWSADGRYLAYVSQRGFDPTDNTERIIGIRTVASGEEREIRPRLLYFGKLDWSPDGRRLLTSGTDAKGRDGVFTVDVQTGDVTLVTTAPRSARPLWSPDGTRVIYLKRDGGPYVLEQAIVEHTLANGTERVIVPAARHPGAFAPSPDGKSVAYLASDSAIGAPSRTLMSVRLDTGETREIIRSDASRQLSVFLWQWTPASDALLVHMTKPNELWLVPVHDGAPRKVELDVRDWSFGGIGHFAVHPNGRTIAFLTGQLSTELVMMENFLPSSR